MMIGGTVLYYAIVGESKKSSRFSLPAIKPTPQEEHARSHDSPPELPNSEGTNANNNNIESPQEIRIESRSHPENYNELGNSPTSAPDSNGQNHENKPAEVKELRL